MLIPGGAVSPERVLYLALAVAVVAAVIWLILSLAGAA
jgi:preprotein translocase subunit Sec61beta